MAHRTFFSFDYDEDIWRATNVRKSGALNRDDIEFIDASLWEEAETKGRAAIERLIDGALANSTVTCVLIGARTASRPWVKYEINETIRLGKGLFGVHVYKIRDRHGNQSTQGADPVPAPYETYYWVKHDGAKNLGRWVDAAYDQVH